MSRHHPTLHRLCHLVPWQHPPWPQIKAQRLTMSPLQAPGGGFALAAACSFIWGADAYLIKNRAMGVALALGGCRSMKTLNNQLVVEGSSWIDIRNEARGW